MEELQRFWLPYGRRDYDYYDLGVAGNTNVHRIRHYEVVYIGRICDHQNSGSQVKLNEGLGRNSGSLCFRNIFFGYNEINL